MKHVTLSDYEKMSEHCADIIVDELKKNPHLVLCMASGHTPTRTCELLVEKIKKEHIDTSGLTFIGLDEWVGLSPDNEGSCHYYFQHQLIHPLGLQSHQFHLFDAMSEDLQRECEKMDAVIEQNGIDIMIVGIGINGHIGFNEPGIPFTNKCHVAQLEDITKEVGQKYFSGETQLDKGITIGFHHLMNAKQVILLANGIKKATVIKEAIMGPVSASFPASIMQIHANGLILTCSEASSLLS
ncbi:MAG: glucosamine-6-phosphate deaminase [Chitinophagaceae bacterium]